MEWSHTGLRERRKKRNYAAASPSIVLLLVDGWRMGSRYEKPAAAECIDLSAAASLSHHRIEGDDDSQ